MISVFGIWVCGKIVDDLGVYDYFVIVWDEVVGYYIIMIGVVFSW